MTILRRTFLFSILFTATAFAGDTYMLDARSYFIRSTASFGSNKSNVVGVLSRGSTFEVLKREPRSDGSEALEIRVISLTTNGNLNPSPTDTYWVYKSNDEDFLKRGTTRASRSTSPQGGTCTNCSPSTGAPIPGRTQEDLARISREATRAAEEAPEPAVAPPTERPLRNTGPIQYAQNILKYSNSNAVKNTIATALRRKYARSRGKCYRWVKDALAAGGLIPSWYGGVPASGAKNALKERGFINLLETPPYKGKLTSPSQAPKGAVLVYSSGVPCKGSRGRYPDCGHVEIKVGEPGQPGYVSDYRSETAINETPRARRYGSKYRLIGVMVKPM